VVHARRRGSGCPCCCSACAGPYLCHRVIMQGLQLVPHTDVSSVSLAANRCMQMCSPVTTLCLGLSSPSFMRSAVLTMSETIDNVACITTCTLWKP
jgi:hypothetical protein